MDIFGILSPLLTSVINRIWPDPTERDKAKLAQFQAEIQLQVSQNELLKGQIETNKAEASNDNLFVAGWRPLIGWVCGAAFLWAYMLQPMITYFIIVSGHAVPTMPALNTVEMITVLTGMLGLGTLRSFDKLKNTA